MLPQLEKGALVHADGVLQRLVGGFARAQTLQQFPTAPAPKRV